MKKREHKILDHTIISYFLLVIFVQLIDEGLGIRIDRLIGNYIPGYTFETMGVGGNSRCSHGHRRLDHDRRRGFRRILGTSSDKRKIL